MFDCREGSKIPNDAFVLREISEQGRSWRGSRGNWGPQGVLNDDARNSGACCCGYPGHELNLPDDCGLRSRDRLQRNSYGQRKQPDGRGRCRGILRRRRKIKRARRGGAPSIAQDPRLLSGPCRSGRSRVTRPEAAERAAELGPPSDRQIACTSGRPGDQGCRRLGSRWQSSDVAGSARAPVVARRPCRPDRTASFPSSSSRLDCDIAGSTAPAAADPEHDPIV